MQNQALAKPVSKPGDIRSYIQSEAVKKQIAMALPKHLTADVMARVVCTAILKQPKLATCRIESLLQSVMLLSQFGLLPDGRNAHLIAYGDTCQAIVDYKGYISRAQENGLKNISYDVVCVHDKFTWKKSSAGLDFAHEPDWRNPDRGEMFAAYCTWTNSAGQFEGEIMTKLEIDGIRKRSKAANAGPWVTDYSEMAKKTVVRRAAKRWPLDAKFKEALDTGKLASAATVDVELAAEEPAEAAAAEFGGTEALKRPDDSNAELAPAKAAAKETVKAESSKEFLTRLLAENGITFDEVQSYCLATNTCSSADSFGSVDELPLAVVDLLIQPAKMAKLIKTYKK